MQLSKKTLEKLREVINGDGTDHYRSGPMLVSFFNQIGFSDIYGQGFPSRWFYTEDRLQKINGTPELDKCIKMAFAVIDFVGKIDELDNLIADFNQYLAFDKWEVIRDNDVITFRKRDRIIVESTKKDSSMSEDEFLKRPFNINIDLLGLDPTVNGIIKMRLKEVESCVKNDAPLASVIMIGSILEGILLGIASSYPQQFNRTLCAPKDKEGKIKKFPDWTLNNFIDAASEVGFLKADVKKFSHAVRDFRNYIHPYSQMASQFTPDNHTAMICFQVLNAAISQIGDYRKSLQGGAK